VIHFSFAKEELPERARYHFGYYNLNPAQTQLFSVSTPELSPRAGPTWGPSQTRPMKTLLCTFFEIAHEIYPHYTLIQICHASTLSSFYSIFRSQFLHKLLPEQTFWNTRELFDRLHSLPHRARVRVLTEAWTTLWMLLPEYVLVPSVFWPRPELMCECSCQNVALSCPCPDRDLA
jgi:hypothetical protein